MPLKAVSKENGTQILLVKRCAESAHRSCSPTFASSKSKCQDPLRLSQSFRVNWGRGYSGRGICGGHDACRTSGACCRGHYRISGSKL